MENFNLVVLVAIIYFILNKKLAMEKTHTQNFNLLI